MNMDNFNPDDLVDIALKNQQFVLQAEMEKGVSLNYLDDTGQYVFRHMNGTMFPTSLDLSFNENLERHKKIMQGHE